MKLLFENWRKYLEEEMLYHGTSDLHKQDILDNGIKEPSYWGTGEVAEYYAEEVARDGGNPLIIGVPLSEFDQSRLEPDDNSVGEPLTYTLDKTEYQISKEWEKVDGTWQDSLDIVGSVKYTAHVCISEEQIK